MKLRTVKTIFVASTGTVVAMGIAGAALDKFGPIYSARKEIDRKIAAIKIQRSELQLDINSFNSVIFTGTEEERKTLIKQSLNKIVELNNELIDLIKNRPAYL